MGDTAATSALTSSTASVSTVVPFASVSVSAPSTAVAGIAAALGVVVECGFGRGERQGGYQIEILARYRHFAAGLEAVGGLDPKAGGEGQRQSILALGLDAGIRYGPDLAVGGRRRNLYADRLAVYDLDGIRLGAVGERHALDQIDVTARYRDLLAGLDGQRSHLLYYGLAHDDLVFGVYVDTLGVGDLDVAAQRLFRHAHHDAVAVDRYDHLLVVGGHVGIAGKRYRRNVIEVVAVDGYLVARAHRLYALAHGYGGGGECLDIHDLRGRYDSLAAGQFQRQTPRRSLVGHHHAYLLIGDALYVRDAYRLGEYHRLHVLQVLADYGHVAAAVDLRAEGFEHCGALVGAVPRELVVFAA